jgi:hypothetical protein
MPGPAVAGSQVPVLQGLADGLGDEMPDGAFAVELHLALGGVDVDVDFGRIDFEEQAGERVTPLHQGVVVPLHQRQAESTVCRPAAG